jgi:folate-binding protein YgfZ
MNDFPVTPAFALTRLGLICVTGADARTYLQGQLSFDLDALTPSRMELASCNSSLGRVQAVLWIVERTDGVLLLAPREIVDATIARLRKYVLRSKVKVENGAEKFVLGGTFDVVLPMPRAHEQRAQTSLIAWPSLSPRTLVIAPAGTAMTADAAAETRWHLADIESGLTQVYAGTQEQFVAQMLNLDLLGGISFEKGCYTGQEIIARTHFRGTVKRRTLRFAARCKTPAPGTRVLDATGGHAGDVVDSVATADGCELLAVISLTQADHALRLADIEDSSLQRKSLPYDVA